MKIRHRAQSQQQHQQQPVAGQRQPARDPGHALLRLVLDQGLGPGPAEQQLLGHAQGLGVPRLGLGLDPDHGLAHNKQSQQALHQAPLPQPAHPLQRHLLLASSHKALL